MASPLRGGGIACPTMSPAGLMGAVVPFPPPRGGLIGCGRRGRTGALTLSGTLGHDGARFTSARQGGPGVLTESAVIKSRTLSLGADYVWGFPGLRLLSHLGFDRSTIRRDSLECASGTSPN